MQIWLHQWVYVVKYLLCLKKLLSHWGILKLLLHFVFMCSRIIYANIAGSAQLCFVLVIATDLISVALTGLAQWQQQNCTTMKNKHQTVFLAFHSGVPKAISIETNTSTAAWKEKKKSVKHTILWNSTSVIFNKWVGRTACSMWHCQSFQKGMSE